MDMRYLGFVAINILWGVATGLLAWLSRILQSCLPRGLFRAGVDQEAAIRMSPLLNFLSLSVLTMNECAEPPLRILMYLLPNFTSMAS